jgi:NADPH-dependent glutamate synthase beta subunit-like oxidoreductase
MPSNARSSDTISLFFSRSSESTRVNQTGAWRYVRPVVNEKTAPCSVSCPTGEDIARIQMLSAKGALRQAWHTILEENPFPAICGYVCYYPCEAVCNRAAYDTAVGINAVERSLGIQALDQQWVMPTPGGAPSGRKVAVIGAGPAGLSAAFFLSQLGHACDVYEAQREPGGLLRWGIPSFRLPPAIVAAEIERLRAMGVRIRSGQPIDPARIDALQQQYDAIFVGCGHQHPIRLHLPGEDLAIDGRRFLEEMRRGERPALQGLFAVIGGGNTAVDVARSLLRLGAQVTLCYRRRRQDMPAFAAEIAAAEEEGVQIRELVGPLGIKSQGTGFALQLAAMRVLETRSADGRARVAPADNSREVLSVKGVVTALGAGAASEWQQPLGQRPAQIELETCRLTQGPVPVAYGGDLTNPTRSVAAAIASGKTAAMALDSYFDQGWDAIVQRLADCRVGTGPAYSMAAYQHRPRQHRNPQTVAFEALNTAYFTPAARVLVSESAAPSRVRSFEATIGTYSSDETQSEAQRCFNCGICNACDTCALFCPELAVKEHPQRHFALEYCKGCGICVVECPRCALSLEEEAR